MAAADGPDTGAAPPLGEPLHDAGVVEGGPGMALSGHPEADQASSPTAWSEATSFAAEAEEMDAEVERARVEAAEGGIRRRAHRLGGPARRGPINQP